MAGKKKTAVSSTTDSSSDSSSASSSGSSSNNSSDSSSSSDSENDTATSSATNLSKSKQAEQKLSKKPSPTVTKQKILTEEDDDDDDVNCDKMAEKKKLQVKRKNNVRPKVSATLLTAAAVKTISSCQKVTGSQTGVNNNKTSSSSKKSKSIFSPENSSNDEQQQQQQPQQSKCQKKKRRKSTSTTTSSTTTTSSSVNTSTTTSNSSDSSSDDNDDDSTSTMTNKMSKVKKRDTKQQQQNNKKINDNSSSIATTLNVNKLTAKKPVKKKLTRQQTSIKRKTTTSTSIKKLKQKIASDNSAVEESDSNNVSKKSPVKRQTPVNNLSTTATTNNSGSSNKQKVKETSTITAKKDSGTAVKLLSMSTKSSSTPTINCQKKVTKCPLDTCDSTGHLTGRFDRHFTLEACPNYHNVTHAQCKFEAIERKKREEMRRRAIDTFNATRITAEQRNYLTHVKMLRQNLGHTPPAPSQQTETNSVSLQNNNGKLQSTATAHVQKSTTTPPRTEPDLRQNFVADYDLKLFRDAQALSSETIEETLRHAYATNNCTKIGTKFIEMGRHEMAVWYQSPYPEDFARLPKLYICQFCLRYMKSVTILERHVIKCVWRHPPGDEVYRKDKVSVWEVDGKKYKQYCQNLCLLAKFFLDHKTLYYDVEPFLFYIMTVNDSDGCHTIGYFSKEKNSFLNYNVSCILTLPPYQRQGYGRLLIDFSYLLTRVEGKIGSPEKPLSDLGLISYRSYWKDVLLNYLCARAGTTLSVKDISQEMAIHSYDIVSTLQALGMMKYWKGKHIILKKQDVLDEYQERVKRRCQQFKEIDPTCLRWRPPTCQTQTPP